MKTNPSIRKPAIQLTFFQTGKEVSVHLNNRVGFRLGHAGIRAASVFAEHGHACIILNIKRSFFVKAVDSPQGFT